MMSPSPYFALFPLYPDFAISLVLNSLQNTNELITLSEPTSLIPSNASVIIDNFTIKDTANLTSSTHLSIPKIDCDDERFGTPSVASCKDAIAEIPQDPATIIRDPNRSYGPRGEGTWDVNLPKRYISCEHPDPSITVWLILDSGWAVHYRSYSNIHAFSCEKQ